MTEARERNEESSPNQFSSDPIVEWSCTVLVQRHVARDTLESPLFERFLIPVPARRKSLGNLPASTGQWAVCECQVDR